MLGLTANLDFGINLDIGLNIGSLFGSGRYQYNMFNTQISILSGSYMQGFMGVIGETSTSTTTPTRYPVEDASQIRSDHVHINPQEISFSVLVSGSHYSTPADVFSALRNIQEQREPIAITTNLKAYNSMILTSISGTVEPSSNRAIIEIKAVEVLVAGCGGAGTSTTGGSSVVMNYMPRVLAFQRTTRRGRAHHAEVSVDANLNTSSKKKFSYSIQARANFNASI